MTEKWGFELVRVLSLVSTPVIPDKIFGDYHYVLSLSKWFSINVVSGFQSRKFKSLLVIAGERRIIDWQGKSRTLSLFFKSIYSG